VKMPTLLENIVSLWSFLGKRRLWQLGGLFTLMLLSVMAEMVSLGAIVPFLGALTNPEDVLKLAWLKPILQLFGIDSADQLLLPLTGSFIMAAVMASGIKILLLWCNTRIGEGMTIQLNTEMYRRALYTPYEVHLASNSSNMISLVTQKMSAAASAGITHIMMFTIALLTSFAIIFTLFLINPLVALTTFSLLGGGYVLVGYVSRRMLKRNSHVIAQNQPFAVKQLQEGIGGIRDVILDHSQEVFLKNYSGYIQIIQRAFSSNSIISMLPKYVLELLGIVLIAVMAYVLSLQGKAALPVLGAMALGAQRLLPSLQQSYYSWSFIAGSQSALNDVVSYLNSKPSQENTGNPAPFPFNHTIALEHVAFSYVGTRKNVLENMSLTIQKGARVGFIGETGSGKSTLLDLIMGLFTPIGGKMLVDGVKIDEQNRQAWQKHIAHVPQSIYLSDASITENIAFGMPKEYIDFERVQSASKKAHLHHFIEELPNGYETYVGERGVQLSGGQRQRIGIARALYKQADVIIFDEATSALDDTTEKIVMEAINSLDENLTILMIAHRLSTLKDCDVIYRLSHGRIIESGSYEQVCLLGADNENT